MKRTILGIERLLDDQIGIIRGLRVGLVCNQASVMPDTFAHAADVFGERRPRGHQRGEFSIEDAPFALVTTPGTTPGRWDDA